MQVRTPPQCGYLTGIQPRALHRPVVQRCTVPNGKVQRQQQVQARPEAHLEHRHDLPPRKPHRDATPLEVHVPRLRHRPMLGVQRLARRLVEQRAAPIPRHAQRLMGVLHARSVAARAVTRHPSRYRSPMSDPATPATHDAFDAPTRTALITGASGGIGLAMARALLEHGFDVTLVARPTPRGERAAADLAKHAGRDGAVTFLPADLASLKDVRRLAQDVRARTPHLDLLVNNAGAFVYERALTEDGFERTFALNHLSPFLLTHLVTDLLLAAPEPRIVTTSSAAERMGAIDLERAASGTPYSAWRAYGWSKQANIHFAREAARRAPDPKVRAYAFHPGFVNTGFGGGSGVLSRFVALTQRWFARTPEQGADTGVWASTATPAIEPNGAFLVDRKVSTPSSAARDDAMARDLWERSEAWVELTPAERWNPDAA